MKLTLYIDTSNSKITKVGIFKNNNKKYYEEKTDIQKSQNLLPLIEKALSNFSSCHSRARLPTLKRSDCGQEGGNLNSVKLTLKDITEIKVNEGPGSFTGIRVGISVANALGFVLKIPVNGKKISYPKYQESKFD